MPSRWILLCCPCVKDDKYQYQKPYARVKGKTRAKKPPDQKFTWTRKSLLQNEQSEEQEGPYDHYVYQAKPDGHHGHHEPGNQNSEIELQSFEEVKHKRRSAKDVFANIPEKSQHTSGTTFPWMNEEFVPNGRSVTRLGISSVQINAMRNEQASRNSSGNVSSPNAPRKANIKSKSFNDGQNHDNHVYSKPMIRTNVSHSNVRTVPNGHQHNAKIVPNGNGFRGNVTSVANKGNTVAVPVEAGRSERPMLLHASNSNVGVRVLPDNNSHNKNTRVPKLGDYLLLKPDTKIPINQGHSSNTRPGDHQHTPFNYKPFANETHSDVSFASEITFKKYNTGSESNNVSLKRSNQPTIFSTNVNKYERLNSRADAKLPSYQNKVKGHNSSVESMYGYVPKAVQNVHASNALSGGKLDDFFMRRMDDRELQKFASIDRKEHKDWSHVMETSYLGDAHKHGRPKSVPSYINADQNPTRPTSAVEVGHTGYQNDYTNARVGLQQIRLAPPPNRDTTNTNAARFTNGSHPNMNNYVNIEIRSRGGDTGSRGGGFGRDENENKVIMIDFPPNVKKDMVNNNANVNGHNDNSTVSDDSRSRDTGRFMANHLTGSKEVLY